MSYKGYLDEQLPSNIGAADSLEYGTGIDRVNAQRLTRSTGDVTREDSLITDNERDTIRNRYNRPIHTVEEKHQRLNAMFGIKPFSAAVTSRPLSEHSEIVKELYAEPKQFDKEGTQISLLHCKKTI